MSTAFLPPHPRIARIVNRWLYDDRDVSDLPFWWISGNRHQWQASLEQVTIRSGGCPTCTLGLVLERVC